MNADSESIASQLTIAMPWRRLIAAATDVTILLAFHWICFLLLLGYNALPQTPALILASTLSGWLYLWVSWSWSGATFGQRLWHIRVVNINGGKLSPSRAALRCIGYALASLPLKGGFLSILWHPQRQGWHDRLARTVVVNDSHCHHQKIDVILKGDPQPEGSPIISTDYSIQTAGEPKNLAAKSAHRWQPPDLSAPRRGWFWVLLAYVLLAVAMTYPLLLHFTTHRAGVSGDGEVFLWNYWYFSHALQTRQSPLITNLLFYPQAISLSFNTMNWFGCLLAVPLLKIFSLTVTYNLLFLTALSTSAFSLYWTVCSLTRHRSASFVAGLAFGFSPYFMSHGLGHMNLISAEFIAPFALFFYASLTATSARRAFLYSIGAGLMLALAGYCDWYNFVFCLTLLSCLFVVFIWGKPLLAWRRYLGLAIVTFATGTVLLTPILAPALIEKASANVHYMNTPLSVVDRFHGDLADYFQPYSLHYALKTTALESSNFVERSVAPGFVMLALAVIGIGMAWRKMYPWLWVILIAFLLCCGPTLTMFGQTAFPQWLLLMIGGPPGFGFGLPWNNSSLVSLALHAAADPSTIFTARQSIVMPFAYLPQLLPPLQAFKVPSRFGLLVIMGIAIFAACGLAYLQERWRNKISAKVLSSLCAILVLLGYLSVPYPLHSTQIPQFYPWLATQNGDFAIIDAPLLEEDATFQWYQTAHHKPIFIGYISREPSNTRLFIESNALLRFLSNDFSPESKWQSQLKVLSQGNTFSQSLQQLRSVNTRYIVLHRTLMPPDVQGELDKLLRQAGLPVVWNDEQLKVFRL